MRTFGPPTTGCTARPQDIDPPEPTPLPDRICAIDEKRLLFQTELRLHMCAALGGAMQEKDKGVAAGLGNSAALKQALRQPSIKDIARLAKVSHPTVSRALHNSPLVNVQTAAMIRRIADEAGYRASAVARGLVTRRTRTIGLVVTTVADPFASEVVCGIEQTANDHGYSVFLADSHADPDREKKVVQALGERRVDGIIVTSSRVGALYMSLLKEMRVPILLVNDQHEGEFVHSVMIANVEGMCAAAEHLIGLGHRRIAYLGDRFGYQSDVERLAGYESALRAAGIAAMAELVVRGDGKPEAAMAAMETLLRLDDPPTAVCCYNDMSALGAMRQVRAHGLRVPEDISVAGFDDLFFAGYLQPALTTVRQPMRRMGEMAMESLLRLMAGGESVVQIRVGAELVARESTAAVRNKQP
jgi:DNA-binding LacI/PurR family transcriptional regulator